MHESSVTLETRDGPMDATFVTPPAGDRRAHALVVIQEAFGVNDHIRDVCRRLARAGYAALAPEVYHRQGKGVTFGYGELERARGALAGIDNDTLETDLVASLAWLRARPEIDRARVGVIGFCLGGFAAFLSACRTDAATAVCFYGGGLLHPRPGLKLTPLIDEVPRIKAPVLLIFGEADAGIPTADVEALRGELKGRDKVHEIVVYPGAGHGFFCEQRASYHAEAAADAWDITLGWLRDRL